MLSCIFGPDLENLRFLNSNVSTSVSTLFVYMMLWNVYVNEMGKFGNGVTKLICLFDAEGSTCRHMEAARLQLGP